jgi:hypothetical protein
VGTEPDAGGELDQALGGGRWEAAFELEYGHLALDHARVGARGTGREATRRQVAQEAPEEHGELGGADEVEVIDGDADQLDGGGEPQPGGRQAGLPGGGQRARTAWWATSRP